MGLIYKVVDRPQEEVSEMICDRCDKRYVCLYDDDEEFFIYNTTWGYASKKDGEKHEIVLCEDCYDVVFKDVKIKITEY